MANLIKRHFYNGVHYFLDKKNKYVQLSPEFHEQLKNKTLWNKFGFKKIGGSSVGDILLQGGFNSEFAAFCRMTWINLPILDRKYVDAGIAIEPKVLKVIEENLKITHQKNIGIKVFDPEKYNYDFFQDKDEIVGGIPDGYIEELKTILEIKTTGEKNYEYWMKFGPSANYIRQAQLYAYLIDAKVFSIVAAFLHDEDYKNPHGCDIYNRKIKNWNIKLNKETAMDDINKIKNWYKKYTNIGISPNYDENKDYDLVSWLECRNEQEWENLKNKWINEGKLII